MAITDELREWMRARGMMAKETFDQLTAIADRIDAEHEKTITAAHSNGITEYGSMVAREYVKLPVDADGVPIRIGDVMDVGIVFAIGDDGVFMVENGFSGKYDVECFDGFACHHHAPTVEDVLREFAEKMNENMGMYTGEAIDADEWRDADRQTIAEYAAKLRLAEEVDE